MSQTNALISADLAYLDQQNPLPIIAKMAVRVAVTVSKWNTRRTTRRSLKHLDHHLLRDIGVSPHSADIEANKRFWQP